MSITNSPIRISRSFKTGGTLLTDNNSWNRDGDHAARVFSANGGMWYAEGGNDDIHVTHITSGDEALHVNCAVLGPKLVEGAQRDLGIDFSKRVANKEDYRLIRIATPTLWDSLAVTILRHAVQAGKAQHSIKKLREHMGEKVTHDGGTYYLMPTPQRMLDATDAQLNRLGLFFFKSALKAAAAWCLNTDIDLQTVSHEELFHDLLMIPRVGPWTAGVVVCDVTNDFSYYPLDDRTIFSRVRELSANDWPADRHRFADEWRRQAGDNLSSYTTMVLANWGDQAA